MSNIAVPGRLLTTLRSFGYEDRRCGKQCESIAVALPPDRHGGVPTSLSRWGEKRGLSSIRSAYKRNPAIYPYSAAGRSPVDDALGGA